MRRTPDQGSYLKTVVQCSSGNRCALHAVRQIDQNRLGEIHIRHKSAPTRNLSEQQRRTQHPTDPRRACGAGTCRGFRESREKIELPLQRKGLGLPRPSLPFRPKEPYPFEAKAVNGVPSRDRCARSFRSTAINWTVLHFIWTGRHLIYMDPPCMARTRMGYGTLKSYPRLGFVRAP